MPCGCKNKKNNTKNSEKDKTSTKRLPLVTIRKRIAGRNKDKK